MNRDEKRTRSIALPPSIIDHATCRAVFPHEPEGGTWIAVNDAGVCLALINWHRVARAPAHDTVSRGHVVDALAGKSNADEIANGVMKLPLRKLRPFRLITIMLSEKLVTEWRWNLEWLTMRSHEWQRQHWFSSGLNEERAELERQRVCDVAHNGQLGSLRSLRQLHCSHEPKRGPFSICMHRSDAATVSYTEVAVQDRQVIMRYRPGPACAQAPLVAKSIGRVL